MVTTAAPSLIPPPESPTPFSGPWPEVLLLGGLALLGMALRRGVGAQSKRPWPLRWAILAGTLVLGISLAACGGGGGGGGI